MTRLELALHALEGLGVLLLWLRTTNVHKRLAKIERALLPGVRHEVRRGP